MSDLAATHVEAHRSDALSGVTKVVDRIPRPGMETALEDAIRRLTAAAMRHRGHLGVTVTRPAPPAQPGFRLVYRFDTSEHLHRWEESDEQHRLVRIADGYTQGAPRRRVLSGLEAWFTLPAAPAPPPLARMSLVTWFGIFPLVYFYDFVLHRIMPADAPAVLMIAINTALVVPTMSYLVAPRLTRLFKGWLYPQR